MPLDIKQWLRKGERGQYIFNQGHRDTRLQQVPWRESFITTRQPSSTQHTREEIWDLLYQYAQDSGEQLVALHCINPHHEGCGFPRTVPERSRLVGCRGPCSGDPGRA